MCKKLTIEFVREQFEKEGYTLLTIEYVNAHQKLDYICPKEHEGSISWCGWKQKQRCSECFGNKKLTIEFIKKEFEKEDYKLLTKKYINSKQKLKYVCSKDHIGFICWAHWQQGQRCAICSGKKKLTIDFVKKQFEKEGYVLLTKKYIDCKQKLDYICPKGHKWSIRWYNWQQGIRCIECANKKKLTIDFIKKEFEKEGYILLTEEYVNNAQKLEYVCPKGHLTNISWGSWQQGCRCIECAGLKKLTINFIREQFEKEGYKLLTKEYINNKTPLEYICPNGHFWHISWVKWQQGERCKKCFHENIKGKNNPNYNPNLTNEDRIDRRYIPGYAEWSYAVKKRDNFTCQICGGNKGGNLVSHHLESYNNNPDLKTTLSNGVCLCEKCHKEFHSMYGYGNNTKRQFEEFISIGV